MSELIEPSVSFSCRHDSKCSCSINPHDILHRVCGRLFVPGLHSVLCAEGVLHHLRVHLRAELHSSYHQLQTTSLLEWGLETAAAAQAGLTTWQTLTWQSEVPFPLSLFCSIFLFFKTDSFPKNLKLIFWYLVNYKGIFCVNLHFMDTKKKAYDEPIKDKL